MSHYVLASFCNIPTLTTSPLVCLQIPHNLTDPIYFAPVSLGYPDLAFSATGLTRARGDIFALFVSRSGKNYIAILRESDLQPLSFEEVPEVSDGHSILALDDALYVVSTGTDELVAYSIRDHSVEHPRVVWQATSAKADTHHVNSITHMNGEILIAAFGPRSGALWASATEGYICYIDSGSRLAEGLYHPHSLSVRNHAVYYSDSQKNVFCSIGEPEPIFHLGSYSRGTAWLADNLVCVATSIGRRVSKSTGAILNPADPGEPAGECCLFVGDISTGQLLTRLDLRSFGPEIYDLLLLDGFEGQLLHLSNQAQQAERGAIQKLIGATP